MSGIPTRLEIILASEGAHTSDEKFFRHEVALAFRNRGIPSEALRLPITPTGMHYLLNHFDVPIIDAKTWKLSIGGLVGAPFSLTLDDIKSLPSVTMPVTMECAGNGRTFMDPRVVNQPWMHEAVSTAEWTGTPLKAVIERAGLSSDAIELLFTGLDYGIQSDIEQFYQRSLTIDQAMRDEVILAYEMNGAPLEPQHGAPLRLVVPGWYGMTNVKWLDRIEAIDTAFDGLQMQFYRETSGADDDGSAIETMKVRALMAPPGWNTFPTLKRCVDAGPQTLIGRAWAGQKSISRVEVSTDNGASWSDAVLDDPIGEYAWRGWSFEWNATVGQHTLVVRATDSEGVAQPLDQTWSFYGVANNGVASTEVEVR